jgi:hypothetical protein
LIAPQAVRTLEADHDNAAGVIKEIGTKREQLHRAIAVKKKELNSLKVCRRIPLETIFIPILQVEEKSMDDTMLEYQAEIIHIDNDLRKENQSLEEDFQSQRRKLNIRMEVVRDRLAVLQGELVSAGTEKDRLITELAQVDHQRGEAQRQVDVWNGKKQALVGKIATMKSQQKDPLSAFGNNMSEVNNAIKRARWQGHPPIGPLGMFVELDDSAKWGDLMKVHIGHQMRAFAISDGRDFRQLKAILMRTGK